MANAFDTSEYPEVEPARLVIGDRWLWKRTDLTDYPIASYALTYDAVRQGDETEHFTITASESGNDYIIEVASTTTTGYEPGIYTWAAWITRSSDSERLRLATGIWEIVADWATDKSDPRTYAQIQIDDLQALLAKLNKRLFQSYSLGQRQVVMVSIADTRRELRHWQHVRAAEINRERALAGKASATRLQARFS